MTTREIVIAVACVVVGWVLHMLWDRFVEWLYDATDFAGGLVWDVCAIVGIIAVCVALGWAAKHNHWFGT